MKTKTTKKSPVMKSEQPISKETPVRRTRTRATKVVSPIQTEMTKLETAFMAAMTGQMKFKEVKSIFREIHKGIKSSIKKQKN
jgi:ribosome biogenesis protein Nip4